MKMKIKKGDEIQVTAGKDKGKKGKVEKVLPKLAKIVVAGVNMYKRHQKSRGKDQPGGIIDITRPLPVANVAFLCPKCQRVTRIGLKKVADKTVRFCRKCKEEI